MKAVNNKHPGFDESSEKEWKGDFYFIQGSDTQFGMISSYINKDSNIDWEVEMERSRLLVGKINAMRPKPKFFVICGDLTDAWPDGKSNLEMKKKQDDDFVRIFSQVDPEIPLVCVCGNHDVGNTPTDCTILRYRSVYGNDYFSFWAGGVLFLVVNSQYYMDGSLVPDMVMDHEDWLDERLAKDAQASKHSAVVFEHIPPFVKDIEETESGYFALPITSRLPYISKLHSAGVRYVFCGHYHRNAGGFYKNLEVIVTSAIGGQLGNDQPGVRIVKVSSKSITHRYVPLEQIPLDLTKS